MHVPVSFWQERLALDRFQLDCLGATSASASLLRGNARMNHINDTPLRFHIPHQWPKEKLELCTLIQHNVAPKTESKRHSWVKVWDMSWDYVKKLNRRYARLNSCATQQNDRAKVRKLQLFLGSSAPKILANKTRNICVANNDILADLLLATGS